MIIVAVVVACRRTKATGTSRRDATRSGSLFEKGGRGSEFSVLQIFLFAAELPRYRRTRTWRMQTRASRMKARRRRRTTMPRRIDGNHRKGLHAHWAPKFSPNSVHHRIVMPSLCNHNVQTPASSRVLGAPASPP